MGLFFRNTPRIIVNENNPSCICFVHLQKVVMTLISDGNSSISTSWYKTGILKKIVLIGKSIFQTNFFESFTHPLLPILHHIQPFQFTFSDKFNWHTLFSEIIIIKVKYKIKTFKITSICCII